MQTWVMSALLLTTALIFSGGLTALAASIDDRDSSRGGLLVIAAVVGVMGMAGVRALNDKSVLTPWLAAGLLPALVGWYFLYVS